ncbi:MAG: methyltransferase domain-containing protein [Cyanobacteria bacterium P01_D01_bin.105]
MNSFKMDFSLYEDLIEILEPKSVLELGCGMGRLFPIFSQTAEKIVGVDISDELLYKGEQYYESYGSKNASVSFINADMCSFRDDKEYDMIVFALSVLKHLSSHEERFKALENAKRHLSKDGFIVIDHTPFLYASRAVDWTDARQSLVADWLPEPRVLDGYQWRKSVYGEKDVLEWRYNDLGQTRFKVGFTTYQYDIGTLSEHIERLDMSYEKILAEWGINGLSDGGKRFIGVVSHFDNAYSPKLALIEKVKQRNERLWSDHDLYLEAMTIETNK